RGSPRHLGDGAPMWNDQLLMARRLVEAGARCVTVAYGFWDTHGGNFRYLRQHLPLFDQGVSALIEDVYARGLDRDVTVLVWGEFGRTPKINKDAGRDHWARVNGALLAGGGMKVGQVIGSTDAIAGEAKDDPIPYPRVLASVYQHLGIVPALLGWGDRGAAFTAVIQFGTLAAVFLYFRDDVARLFRGFLGDVRSLRYGTSPEARMAWMIAGGTVPVVICGLLFKHQ